MLEYDRTGYDETEYDAGVQGRTALEPRSFQIESIGAVSKVAQATSYIIDQEGHVLWSSGDQAPRLERTHI